MKNKKILFHILVFVTFLSISILLSKRVMQNDTFYSIRIGESILKYGVDMKDHFSWLPNLSYTYPHWLYDLLIFCLYDVGGFSILHIFTIILGFILLYSMYHFSNNLVGNRALSYALVTVSSFALHGFFTVRAQMMSYIFLLIILYSIEMLRSTKNKRYYLYLFICSLLIANMHLAVWLFIFVLFLPFIVQDLIYLFVKKYKLKFVDNYKVEIEKSELKVTLIGLFICFITGFMTPNFLVPFTYLINTYRGISTKFINEHRPLVIGDRTELYFYLLLFVIVILLKKSKIKLRDLFLLCGLFLLSFLSFRSIALFFILSIFSFVRLLNYENDKFNFIIYNEVYDLIVIVFFSILGFCIIKTDMKVPFYEEYKYPIAASDYIIENVDYKNIKLYNEYGYGSYLILRGIPVFIDSRADLYLEEFNDCTAFRDFININSEYEETFKKYGFTHVLLKNDEVFNLILKNDLNYKVIYTDDYFTIYEALT